MSATLNEQDQWVDEATGELVVNGFVFYGDQNLDPVLNPLTGGIFSDRGLTIALSNPQRTGADGRTVNKVWLSGRYSIKVEDVNNVQLYQELDVGENEVTGNTSLTNVQGTNTIAADGVPTVDELIDGQFYVFKPVITNTGAVTLQIDSTTAKAIEVNGGALTGNELAANITVAVAFNLAADVFDMVGQINRDALVLGTDDTVTFGVLNVTEDTSAGLAAALGQTATEGLILTGQGSINDITVKNDADANVMVIKTGGTVVDFPGKVGVGGLHTDGTLHVITASASAFANTNADDLVVENNAAAGMSILTPDASTGQIQFGSPSDNTGASLSWNHDLDLMVIGTANVGGVLAFQTSALTEAMRIDSSQNLLVSKTSPSSAVTGGEIRTTGLGVLTVASSTCLIVNRNVDDGVIISLRQSNVEEGNISVCGTTVSYNGAHLSFTSQLSSTVTNRYDPTILIGTVMEYINEKTEHYFEDWEEEEIREWEEVTSVTVKKMIERKSIQVINGIATLIKTTEEIDEPQFTEMPVIDEEGLPVVTIIPEKKDKKGRVIKAKEIVPVMHREPVVTKETKQEIIRHSKRLIVDGMDYGTGKGTVYKKDNMQAMRSKVSDLSETKKIAGVFESWTLDQPYDNNTADGNEWFNDFTIATTGDFVIRVTGPCEIGDLFESNGDGTARVQSDGIIRSNTVAKATQDFLAIPIEQENPELVPCQLLNG